MLKKVIERLEIVFWNLVVTGMSDSKLVKTLVVETYGLIVPQPLSKTVWQAVALAGLGIGVGFLFGILRAAIR